MSIDSFLERVFRHLPHAPSSFEFKSWKSARPTAEGVGVLPGACDVDKMVARIQDVGGYTGNIDYVLESRVVESPTAAEPKALRFYQRINIPLIAELQMENRMLDHGEVNGWRVVSWEMLEDATSRLDPKRGARFDYNDGAWLLRPDAIGYALSSAPRKKDVGRIKFALMTKGADATASQVLRNNIEGMRRWADAL